MSDVVVSVVIPAHNAAPTIAAALRSALAQEGPAVEAVVVDDGSSDDTAEIAAEICRAEGRVRLHRLREAGGAAAARNWGITLARGAWIAPLDADDRFAPNRLRQLLEVAVDADMVSDDLLLVDGPSGEVLGRAWGPALLAAADPMRPDRFVERNRLDRPGPSFGYMKPIIRRAFLERHALRYPPELKITEDFQLYLDCLLAGARWRLVGAPLYHYLQWPQSLSRQLGPAELEAMLAGSSAHRRRHAALPPEVATALCRRERGIKLYLAHAAAVAAVRRLDLAALLRILLAEPAMLPIFARACQQGALKRVGWMKRHQHLRPVQRHLTDV